MTRMKLLALAGVSAVALGGMGHAQANDWRSGLYIKGGAGWNQTQSQSYDNGPVDTDVKLDDGYSITGALGYQHSNMRTELEVTHRDNDVERVRAGGVDTPGSSGNIDSTAVMVNGYYDFETGTPFTPYVGAGIGGARVRADDYSGAGGIVGASGKDTVFAYQAMAGAEYALDSRFSLFGEYKYFATQDIDVSTTAGNTSSIDYDNHSVGLGVRYKFN